MSSILTECPYHLHSQCQQHAIVDIIQDQCVSETLQWLNARWRYYQHSLHMQKSHAIENGLSSGRHCGSISNNVLAM